MYFFHCQITFSGYNEPHTISETIVAETASKARYKFYKGLDASEPYKDYFKYISSRKIGEAPKTFKPQISDFKLEQFERIKEHRNIPFAEIGMKISVAGQLGIIAQGNSSMNLDVEFGHKNGTFSNCHPTWETIYFDSNDNVIKSFCKNSTN